MSEDADQAVDDLSRMRDIFLEEIKLAADLLKSEGSSQPPSRMLIRSAFAYFEGITYNSKFLLSQVAQSRIEKFVIPELDSRDGFKERLKSAFKFTSQILHSTYRVNYNDDRYHQALLNSVKVRDRLMHPKKTADLLVTADEVFECMEAVNWFEVQWMKIIQNKMLR